MHPLNVQCGQALADAGAADAGAVMRFETGLMAVAEDQAAGRVHVGIASLVFGQHSAALVRAAVEECARAIRLHHQQGWTAIIEGQCHAAADGQ